MEKKHKIIWRLGSILVVLFFLIFFLGACGKKEEATKKPEVVSKKVVSKKVGKPAPKKVKVQKAKPKTSETPTKETPDKKETSAEKSPPKPDADNKEKVSTTTLAAKKKPAFKPRSEISEASDYQPTTSSEPVKVAKKDDAKAADESKLPEAGKKDSGKEDQKPKIDDKAPGTAAGGDDGTVSGEKPKESEGKDGDASSEVKDSDEMQSGSEGVAGLTPSKTLTTVRIDPLSQSYKYKPEGKIDPFSSLFQIQSENKRKRKRFPLTPLEQSDISQFKLVGVILSAKGNKAIVQGAEGKGYVLSRGTYIGVNDGRVVKILKDRVICEEEVENLFGQTEIKARVLILQKPPGAL